VPLGFRGTTAADGQSERAANEMSHALPRAVRVLGGSRAAGVDLVRALAAWVRARAAA
jgi:hypothetical protein